MDEHEQKYEAIAQRIGVERLRPLLPVPAALIRKALAEGDDALNTIPLRRWDRAVGCFFADGDPRFPGIPYEWHGTKGLSLAERVCTLKHVAKFHLQVQP